MQYRQLDENYAVSPQIHAADVAQIKADGFKSVICNRPDNEDPGQPGHEEIQRVVEAAGLAFRWVPVISGQMTQQDVDNQSAALAELEGPVFAYCRSGTRCANLFAGLNQGR